MKKNTLSAVILVVAVCSAFTVALNAGFALPQAPARSTATTVAAGEPARGFRPVRGPEREDHDDG